MSGHRSHKDPEREVADERIIESITAGSSACETVVFACLVDCQSYFVSMHRISARTGYDAIAVKDERCI